MLKVLKINNVALISTLELEFCDKLNILSGETGAGKSIIVDSLMLLLGARYDKTLLRYGESSGFVEGVFDSFESSDKMMTELGFDTDDVIIVTRKFYADGKNDIRINGRAATTSMLRQLMSVLVDIYGQNEYQTLSKPTEHLRLLDYFVRHETQNIKKNIATNYLKFKQINSQLAELGELDERERNINLLKYQIDEIEKAKIGIREEEDLIDKRKMIASSEKINTSLGSLINALAEDDDANAQTLVSISLKNIAQISDLSDAYDNLYERLNSLNIELMDIVETAQSEIENLNFDFDDLDKIEKRLELIRSLKRKYGAYDKMQEFKTQSQEQLYTLEHCDELYEKLIREKKATINELYNYSVELHNVRAKGAKEFEKLLIKELSDLGMNNCAFEIVFDALPTIDNEESFTANGIDKAEFYLSPNVGQPLKPLVKIISGGEMSRFMLALKVISSQIDDIPTMIFDEIDTGISGKIGQEVAKKLATISRHHQILCVTHLPQIASMSDNHYYIVKVNENNQTLTKVRLLDSTEKIDEVSRLSGAKDISSQSNLNALQMIKWSDEFKNSL